MFCLVTLLFQAQIKFSVRSIKAGIEDLENKGVATKSHLLEVGKVHCPNSTAKITSFNFCILSAEKNSYQVIRCNSPEFSDEIREKIQNMKPGSRIFIDNIQCQLMDGSLIGLESIWYDVVF